MKGIVLNPYHNSKMALGSVGILTILILSIHEHELSFYLFVYSVIYSIRSILR